MKTITLLCATFFSVFAQAQIPNASFENWTTVTKEGVTYHDVTGWYTPNIANVFNNEPEMATQTADAYEGASALKLSNLPNKYSMSASAFSMIEGAKDEFIDKFPVTGKVTSLKGFYKYDFTGEHDSCGIYLLLFRNGINIGYGEFIGSSKVSEYSPFSVPVQYFQDSIPDSASINIYTSRGDFHEGSVLHVDAFSFTTVNTSLREQTKPRVSVSIFPNPVFGTAGIEFELMQPGTTSVEVYNVLGALVHVLTPNGYFEAGKHRLDWNTSNFPEGMYFVKITQDTAETTMKVLIK